MVAPPTAHQPYEGVCSCYIAPPTAYQPYEGNGERAPRGVPFCPRHLQWNDVVVPTTGSHQAWRGGACELGSPILRMYMTCTNLQLD